MKYVICGADRETGEEIELVVEAESSDAARAKASKRSILVSGCSLAESGSNPPAMKTKQQVAQAKGRRLLKSLGILVAVIGVTFAIIYFSIIRPENAKIDETLQDASDALGRSAKRETEIADSRAADLDAQADLFSNDRNVRTVRAYLMAARPVLDKLQRLRNEVKAGTDVETYRTSLTGVVQELQQAKGPPADNQPAVELRTKIVDALRYYDHALREWESAVQFKELREAGQINRDTAWQQADRATDDALKQYHDLEVHR